MQSKLSPVVLSLSAALAASAMAAPAAAKVVYKDGDKYVELGGRIQVQYTRVDPDNGDSTDRLFFRRLRPFVAGSLHPEWYGKFQVDFGNATDGNEVAVKDAYLKYSGLKGMTVSVGNKTFPFSREQLTSSKYQQLVERTFVGDHNYGTPDRQLGIYLDGQNGDKKFLWSLALASAGFDPNNSRLDFDSVAVRGDDWAEGWMIGGRLEYQPLGPMKFSQGDFSGKTLLGFGIGAFTWSNDEDNLNGNDTDVDKVSGVELSAALRSGGLSVDAQINGFNAELLNDGVNSGLYEDSEADLVNFAIEGGYMVVPSKLEVIAGLQSQDAESYATEWNRYSLGANYFFHKHDVKVQLTYQIGENLNGVRDNDADQLFLQTQYVF